MSTGRRSSTVALDLDDIQGFVLRAYRLPVASYTFLEVVDPVAALGWISDIAGQVTRAAQWSVKPTVTLNIAISHIGLRRLGLPETSLDSFAEPFRAGMAQRSALLGDVGESAPPHWEPVFRETCGHVLLVIGAADPAVLDDRATWLRNALAGSGLRIAGQQLAATNASGREHFGFLDGLSQPAIEGAQPSRTALLAHGRGNERHPIRAGEFVFGYPDEENVLPDAPSPAQLARNGSYLVYRKLSQRVALFRESLQAAAEDYPGGADLLAAKLMGRWPDGTPLALSPDHPDPALAADPLRNNSFEYGDDRAGYRCPLGAHIRRANPRDSLPFDGKLVNRHRVVRRGMSYGPPLPAGASDDGQDRGLIFMCFNADISRQFEFVQSQWLNDGNAFNLFADKDFFLGDHDGTGKATVQGTPPHFASPLSRLVTVRGGEYYFVPGIRALRSLGGELPGAAGHRGT